MSTQWERIVRKIPIDLVGLVNCPDGSQKQFHDRKIYTPDSWRESVGELDKVLKRLNLSSRCLISRRPLDANCASSEEHVILQGLGPRWAKLPPGMVHDEINRNFSGRELAFLRTGMMRVIRPLYVMRRKPVGFTDDEGKEIIFTNDTNKNRFVVEVKNVECDFDSLQDSPNGTISITLPFQQSNPLDVSLALHKIAYLLLCVLNPLIALSVPLEEIRQWLANENVEQFRAYGEEFFAGQPPGFGFTYACGFSASPENRLRLTQILVQMRIHCMRYTLSLAGDQIENRPQDYKFYENPESKENTKTLTINFGFEGGFTRWRE